MYKALYAALCLLYRTGLRKVLVKAVDDTTQEWDSKLMQITDGLFDYEEG